jgi:hypothetical protein
MGVGVDQQVVDVDNHILEVPEYTLHESLKRGWEPSSPIGEVTQWNCPVPSIVKAVSGWDFSFSFICQNPEVRSSIEKMLEFALPMSLMHSVISFIEYLSMWEFWLSSWKSCTIRSPCPCFFGTQKIGEL